MATYTYASFQFATTILGNYDAQILSIAERVADLELLLNELRTEKKNLEAQKQALQTLASAGQSAIDQAARFLTMTRAAERGDLEVAFWTALQQLGDYQQLPELPAETNGAATETEETEIIEAKPKHSQATLATLFNIEEFTNGAEPVKAETETETETETEEAENDEAEAETEEAEAETEEAEAEPDGTEKTPMIFSKKDLAKKTVKTLRELCAEHGIKTHARMLKADLMDAFINELSKVK